LAGWVQLFSVQARIEWTAAVNNANDRVDLVANTFSLFIRVGRRRVNDRPTTLERQSREDQNGRNEDHSEDPQWHIAVMGIGQKYRHDSRREHHDPKHEQEPAGRFPRDGGRLDTNLTGVELLFTAVARDGTGLRW
jgi:hypothetical protein